MHLPDALRPPAGSLAWLVLHEVRLTFRSGYRGAAIWLRLFLLLALLAVGSVVGFALWGVPMVPRPRWLVTANAALILLLTFMTTQSLLNGLRTLFEKSDLDLLLSSPLPREKVLAAKLLGLAASAASTYALLLLPFALPVAVLGHPRLLAIVPVLAGLAMVSASLGVGLAILMVRTIGARSARTIGQIVAAALGGAIYLTSQMSGSGRRGGGRLGAVADWLLAHGWGAEGWSSLPARALFGEVGPLLLVVAASALLFAVTAWLFRTHFLASVQSGAEHAGRRRKAPTKGSGFHGALLGAVVAKELRLLVRHPEILFVVLLRLIYLLPLVLLAGRHGAGPVLGDPSLAAVGVIAAGQMCGSLAWLTISAEDAPDLLAVSPVAPGRLKRMKLAAALVAMVPVAALVPLVLVWRGELAGAAIACAGTVVAGAGAGWIELLFGKPAQRSTFRRRQGSLLTSLLGVALALVLAAATGAAVYFVD